MVQPEFVAQSVPLQLGLATIELEYWQRHLLQDDTVFADLAEHIFACENATKRELNYISGMCGGIYVTSRAAHPIRWQSNPADMERIRTVVSKWC